MSTTSTDAGRRWRNWAGNARCRPRGLARPTTEAELAAVVRDAHERGGTVRVAGSGHSCVPLVPTNDVVVSLDRYRSVLAVDVRAATITVEAGCTLRTVNAELATRGLALENLGDIDRQTVSGAISTATHGSGAAFGVLSTQVAAMRIVLGTGQVVECSPEVNPKLFRVARVGLGALGAISTVTLRCVPAFRLAAVVEPRPVDELVEGWDELLATHDHAQFFWIPRTRWAILRTARRTDEPAVPRTLGDVLRDDVLVDNVGVAAMAAVGRVRPGLVPVVARRLPSKRRVEFTDRSDRVLAGSHWVRFLEAEFAIPRDSLPEALGEVRRLCDDLGQHRSLPVEVRAVAGDDIPLSPAFGRPTAYLSVHAAAGEPHQRYFRGVEAIADRLGGRPHWGKWHTATAESLAPRYPRWQEVVELRAKVDPRGVFATRYLDGLLGPLP